MKYKFDQLWVMVLAGSEIQETIYSDFEEIMKDCEKMNSKYNERIPVYTIVTLEKAIEIEKDSSFESGINQSNWCN